MDRVLIALGPAARTQPDKQEALGGQEGGRVPPHLVIVRGVPSSQLKSRLSILKSS